MSVLSDVAVRLAKTTGKAYTLSDSKGFWLAVTEQGGKSWHFRYYWNGKQKRMSLGTYPAVSLKQARALRDEAHELVARGNHPGQFRKQNREQALIEEANTFEIIFEKWYAHRCLSLKEGRQTTRSTIKRVFAKDVLPFIGKRPISEIKRVDLLDLLARVEERKALSVAERIRGWLNQLFRYALVLLPNLENNPATDLDVVAAPQPPVRHNPHLRMSELPKLLQRLRSYRGGFQTQLGVRLLLLTGVRTGELRQATPEQFDVEQGLWIIPPEVVKQLQTKMRRKRQSSSDIPPYIVPLPFQAIEIVKFMLDQFEPGQIYLFHHRNNRKKKISENTLNGCLKRIGYQDQLTGHGIRGTISTALNNIGYPKDWIESQLSHGDPNKERAAYNHAEYIEQRRAMMQDWADRLDMLEQEMIESALSRLSFEHAKLTASTFGAKIVPLELHRKKYEKPDSQNVPSNNHRLPALVAPKPPQSEEERMIYEQLDTFELPHNLPVATFAKMAGKSIRTLNYQIATGHYLALKFGNLGKRIPNWHLDPRKHALIESVLKLMQGVDHWQLYQVLSSPDSRLGNTTPLEFAKSGNLPTVVMSVCQSLKGCMASFETAA